MSNYTRIPDRFDVFDEIVGWGRLGDRFAATDGGILLTFVPHPGDELGDGAFPYPTAAMFTYEPTASMKWADIHRWFASNSFDLDHAIDVGGVLFLPKTLDRAINGVPRVEEVRIGLERLPPAKLSEKPGVLHIVADEWRMAIMSRRDLRPIPVFPLPADQAEVES